MSIFNLLIETERLVLRPFTTADIPASYELNLDAEVSKYTGDGGVVNYDEISRRIREDVLGDYQKHGFGRLAVELKSNGDFIGFCGMKYLDDLDEVDLGFRLSRQHWGKGLATEAAQACINWAFNDLNLNTIIALVLPENKASVKVLVKLNFTFYSKVVEDGLDAHKYVLHKSQTQ